MDIWVLDHTFKSIYLVDGYQTIIWTESYMGYGDFELFLPINETSLEVVTFIRVQRNKKLDTYLFTKDSDQIMIVEKIEMSTSWEEGPRMLLTGRSLECIIERRIVWNQTILNGNLQNAIQRLLNENIINPWIRERKIDNFIFVPSTDPRITSLKVDTQFTGDNLYDAIVDLCLPLSLGFHVSLDKQNRFVFQLYFGTDRSYNQTTNPYVIFSPKFENLVTSNLLEDVTEYKTITLVAGEDEAHERRTQVVARGGPVHIPDEIGLGRRELYTDARDIQSEYYDDEGNAQQVPDEEYYGSLTQRGEKNLADYPFKRIFEGEVEPTVMFIYGVHFFKGDIVQVETEYNVQSKMRIVQMVRTQEAGGIKAYPVFEII